MKRVVVSEQALRDLVREALGNKGFAGWSSNNDGPASVEPNVDPSVAVTDPVNPSFTPQTKTEFGVAVNQLVKNMADDELPKLYDTVKSAIEAGAKKDEDQMKTKNVKNADEKVVEEAIRRLVRKELAAMKLTEAQGDPDPTSMPPPPPSEPSSSPRRRSAYKSSALGSMADVEGASFEEIAKELGFSVAGAKQAVDKALEKAQFLAQQVDPDDLEIIVLVAMNDYIKYLTRSGELTPADIQLMKDHPDIVRELDGFREFLHNHIRRTRKEAGTVDDVDVGDEPEDAVAGVLSRPASRPATPAATTATSADDTSARPKREKDTYKVYPWRGKRSVVRVGKQLYGTDLGGKLSDGEQTKFAGGDRARVAPENGKMKVSKMDSDHSQTWDPIEEK